MAGAMAGGGSILLHLGVLGGLDTINTPIFYLMLLFRLAVAGL